MPATATAPRASRSGPACSPSRPDRTPSTPGTTQVGSFNVTQVGLNGRQVGQGQQLPGRDGLQQHAVCDQGQRRQRHRHRLPGGQGRHPADRHRTTPSTSCPASRSTRRRPTRPTSTPSASSSPTPTPCMWPTRATAHSVTRPRTRTRAWKSGRSTGPSGDWTTRFRPAWTSAWPYTVPGYTTGDDPSPASLTPRRRTACVISRAR